MCGGAAAAGPSTTIAYAVDASASATASAASAGDDCKDTKDMSAGPNCDTSTTSLRDASASSPRSITIESDEQDRGSRRGSAAAAADSASSGAHHFNASADEPFSSRTPTPTPTTDPTGEDDYLYADAAPTASTIKKQNRKQQQQHSRPLLKIGDAPVPARRRSLVQRTHSPKQGISPLTRPVTLDSLGLHRLPAPPVPVPDASPASGASTSASASTPQQIPVFFGAQKKKAKQISAGKKRRRWSSNNNEGSTTTTTTTNESERGGKFFPQLKKRRKSPTMGGGGSSGRSNPNSPPSDSRTASPVEEQRTCARQSEANTGINISAAAAREGENSAAAYSPVAGAVDVRTIAPTVRGVREAARILYHAVALGTNSDASSFSLAYPLSPSSNPLIAASPPTPPPALTTAAAAARATSIEGGILSFPTETVYALTTCVTVRPLLRSSSTSSETSATSACSASSEQEGMAAAIGSSPSLNRLLILKSRLPQNIAEGGTGVRHARGIGSDPDPPLLYLHAPSQAREFVQFTKPKTFIIKKSTTTANGPTRSPRSSKSGAGASSSEQRRKVPAVTFSESREVLDRVTNALWPGPVVIYAKAKMRRVAAQHEKLPILHEDDTGGGGGGRGRSHESSSTNSNSDDDINEVVAYAPILPASVLIRGTSTFSGGDCDGNDSTYYVGMKCPSHPLARRVLEEFYSRNNKRLSGGCGGSGNRRRCRSRVVLGFDATVPNPSSAGAALPGGQKEPTKKPPCPTKAREVCAQLLSPRAGGVGASQQDDAEEPSATAPTTTVHVLNGEDKREIFAAPTCQFGAKAFVSLIIDDEARTIRIRKSSEVNGRSSDVLPKDVYLALLKSPSPATVADGGVDASSSMTDIAGARVIAAVLQRWKVVEEYVA